MTTLAQTTRVAPYVWRTGMIKKDVVYGEVGKMRVDEIDQHGKVSVLDRYKVKSFAPKKLAFESCPSCMKAHTGLSRRCADCGESLVYYPRPKENATLKLRQPKQVKKMVHTRLYKTMDTETPLQGVKSSLAYCLYNFYDFKTSNELQHYERVLRDLLKRRIAHREVTTAHIVPTDNNYTKLLTAFPKAKREGLSQNDKTIYLTALLAIAADNGNGKTCDIIMQIKIAHGAESPQDAKLLKDCFINRLYQSQAIVADCLGLV